VALEEALYVVQFGDVASGTMHNGGVVVLETERVFGGDSGYYYVGKYQVRNDQISAEVRVVRYNPNMPNVWLDASTDFQVMLFGQVTKKGIVGQMTRPDKPGISLSVNMDLKELLP
jgi:T3SS negative regulator,GrlR